MGDRTYENLEMNYSSENIKEFLTKLAEEIGMEKEDVSEESKISDLNFDSLAIISTIAVVDECFDTVITMDQFSNCQTIKDIINLTK